MVRPTLAISEDVLHVRTADVWMGWCPPNRLKRGGFLGLLLADFVAEIGIPTARDGWCIFLKPSIVTRWIVRATYARPY